MEPREAGMGAHSVRASGCSWWTGETTDERTDDPLTCGAAAKGGDVGGAGVTILNSLFATDPSPPSPQSFSSSLATS